MKYCEQLALNSLGASMVHPLNHDLGLADRAWAELFSARSFDEATHLHKEIHSSDSLPLALHCSSTGHQFDGVSSDLMAVFTAKSPLEQLQMMTSALRKAMATLSSLKLKPLLERGTSTEQGENEILEISINFTIPSTPPPLPPQLMLAALLLVLMSFFQCLC